MRETPTSTAAPISDAYSASKRVSRSENSRTSVASMISRPIGWSAAEFAILRSVLYASLFEYPLSCSELRRALIESAQTEADILRVFAASEKLQAVLEYRDGLFFPRGQASWVAQRERRERRSLAFLQRHRLLLSAISSLPFVRLVALSGSVAVLNADKHADLDLFVVTSPGRAWLVTLAVVALAKLTRRRKVVCLNFVMTDDRLRVDEQDLFTANQVIHLRPVAGRATYEAFLAANPFVSDFYPNFAADAALPLPADPGAFVAQCKRLIERLLAKPAGLLEHLSRTIYVWHLRRQSTSWISPEDVRLLPGYVKLHTKSHRLTVMRRFEDACGAALEPMASPAGGPATRPAELELAH